jgi:hypothetical protein
MLSNELKISKDLEKMIDMNRMTTKIHSEAVKDSQYVHNYRQVNTIMDRRMSYHSPQRERISSPYTNAYKDINDTDYTKTHKHKIVNNEPVKMEMSRSKVDILR